MGEVRVIARKSFLIFINNIVLSLLGYLGLFFILRYMGNDAYGMIGFGIAYVGLFSFITDIGFIRAHIKRVSEGKDLSKCIGTFVVIKIVLTAIMVTVVLLSVFIWKYGLGRGFNTPDHEMIIYIFVLYYVCVSLSTIPLSTFSGRVETAKQQVSYLTDPLVRVPFAILIAVGSFGVLALAGSYVLGVFVLLITAIYLFRLYPVGKFDREMFKSYFRFAFPIALASSIGVISLNIDKVMLQLFWDETFVGYYFSSQKLTTFLIVMSMSVTKLLFPIMSEQHGKSKIEEIRNLTLKAERYVSMVVIPSAVLIIVFSRPILNILNAELAQNAVMILQIMTVYSLIYCFYSIFANQIVAVDKPRIAVKIGLSVALTNIALNIILIPKDIKSLGVNLVGMGAEGAALATTISVFIGLVLSKIITRRITGTKWNPRIFLHIAAGAIMGATLYYISTVFLILRWFQLIGVGLLGIGIYLVTLWLLREFTKDDLIFFIDILSPNKMKRYIVRELKDKEKKK